MTVIILTKFQEPDYETSKLVKSFVDKDIQVKVCYFNKFEIVINHGIFYDGVMMGFPDAILVRRGSGISRAELAIIRYFELANVPCFNKCEQINLVQDKFHTGEILHNAGIKVPSTLLITSKNTHLVESLIGFPCVIKVVVGSFGVGVYKCESKSEYPKLLEFIDAIGNEKTLIAQEFMGDRPGEDLRVLVIGDRVIGAMKRVAPSGDFRANISNGGTGEKYEITPEISEIALNTSRALGLDIAGIDLLFSNNGFVVCEANSNPGFYGFEKYCNIDIANEISSFIISKIS